MKKFKVGDTCEVICIVSTGCYPAHEGACYLDVEKDDTVLVRVEQLSKAKDIDRLAARFSSLAVHMRDLSEAEPKEYELMTQWKQVGFREPTEEEVAQARRTKKLKRSRPGFEWVVIVAIITCVVIAALTAVAGR